MVVADFPALALRARHIRPRAPEARAAGRTSDGALVWAGLVALAAGYALLLLLSFALLWLANLCDACFRRFDGRR